MTPVVTLADLFSPSLPIQNQVRSRWHSIRTREWTQTRRATNNLRLGSFYISLTSPHPLTSTIIRPLPFLLAHRSTLTGGLTRLLNLCDHTSVSLKSSNRRTALPSELEWDATGCSGCCCCCCCCVSCTGKNSGPKPGPLIEAAETAESMSGSAGKTAEDGMAAELSDIWSFSFLLFFGEAGPMVLIRLDSLRSLSDPVVLPETCSLKKNKI